MTLADNTLHFSIHNDQLLPILTHSTTHLMYFISFFFFVAVLLLNSCVLADEALFIGNQQEAPGVHKNTFDIL